MPIYSYAELKGKIKVGDRVRLDKSGNPSNNIRWLSEEGFAADSLFFRWDDEGTAELLTEEKTLDTVDVGDVVVDACGDEFTIVDTSKNGIVLFLSRASEPPFFPHAPARDALKNFGYTVKQSTPAPAPKEMTLEEVSKALGYPVKIVE